VERLPQSTTNRNEKRHKVLLFDLGGVLVEFRGVEPLVELTRGRLDLDAARRFWLESPAVRKFEIGACTADAFVEEVIGELRLELAPASFLRLFLAWEKGPYEGALGLLETLKPHFVLACLSNNNALHWDLLRDGMGFGNPFHRTFLSHEIGMVKPDPSVFRFVASELDVAADRILFLDDNPECIAGARDAGMDAVRVLGVEEAAKEIRSRYPDVFTGA
jgi:glucose-1-phosphatase